MKYLCAIIVLTIFASCADAPAPESISDFQNVLSNGGFESGNLTEAAADVMGAGQWLTSNSGGNVITPSESIAHSGAHSLAWESIGWNVKEDGTVEDGCVFLLTNPQPHTKSGANRVALSGYVNTADLAPEFQIMVILSNADFSRMDIKTILKGGVKEWQKFNAELDLTPQDQSLFVAFMALGTKGKGAPGCAVYFDDLSLIYQGQAQNPVPEKTTLNNETMTEDQEKADLTPPFEGPRNFRMGFTPFPYAYTGQAIEETNRAIAQQGDMISQHMDSGVPWTEALAGKPFHPALMKDWNDRKNAIPRGAKLLLSVTPLNGGRDGLADYWGEKNSMALPDFFKGKAFDDPDVIEAYVFYCQQAAEFFTPDWMALAIEANDLVKKHPDQWPAFLKLYRAAREGIKSVRPDLPVFVTITLHSLYKESQGNLTIQQDAIRAMLDEMDLLGLSYYSFIETVGDPTQPDPAFQWVRDFAPGKMLAITETGFPAEKTPLADMGLTLPGSQTGQARFYRSLLTAAQRDEYAFIVTFLYRDYDILWDTIAPTAPGFFIAWRDCGLIDGQGEARPAMKLWHDCFNRAFAPLKGT